VIYVLYNIKLEQTLGRNYRRNYNEAYYSWLDDENNNLDNIQLDGCLCWEGERVLSRLITFGVGMMDDVTLSGTDDSYQIVGIVSFIHQSGERFKDIVVVPLVKNRHNAKCMDFTRSYPILNLVEERK